MGGGNPLDAPLVHTDVKRRKIVFGRKEAAGLA